MQKRERQAALLSLISTAHVGSQSQLASRLCEQGYEVTQASVSRDIDELGIVKLNGYYAIPRRLDSESEFGRVSLGTAGNNLIVGRCSSGLASAITVKIDAANIPEIVGTIAGDDTVFIAVKDAQAQDKVIQRVTELFG